jgi:hypothetical protein
MDEAQGLLLGMIVENFIRDLVDEGFLDGCVECKYPTPSVFLNDDGVLLCRDCRFKDEEGMEDAKI